MGTGPGARQSNSANMPAQAKKKAHTYHVIGRISFKIINGRNLVASDHNGWRTQARNVTA